MNNLNYFNNFLNESQSKKIRDYVDFSTFLDWFNKNRSYIAKVLECDVEDIISEEELLKQSSELIEDVINPQRRGNTGRSNDSGDGVDLSGFKDFKELKNKIIHDILHNIYNVSEKEFDKNEYEFSESEFIEEIEVLAIEESFVKYFTKDLDYVKPDFINQNINRLVSFLMMSIIKENPDRIIDILNGDIEPYIEVYDKEYKTKNTPYKYLYDMFYNIPINPVKGGEKIKNGEDFKEWIGWMQIYGEAIDLEDSGDRANFPNSSFLGAKDFSDLDEDETKEFFKQHYNAVYTENELNGVIFDHNDTINNVLVFENDLDTDVTELWGNVDVYNGEESLDILPEEVKEDFSINKRSQDEEILYVNVIEDPEDNLFDSHFLFNDNNELKYIIETKYKEKNYYYTYDINNEHTQTKEGIWDEADVNELLVKKDDLINLFFEYQDQFEKDIEEYIQYESDPNGYKTNIKMIFSSENSLAITRRYFRYNDVLVNNTKIDIDPESGFYTPVSDTLFDDYQSLSKNLITDNAKNLSKIFNTFRGWAIKNVERLKNRKKKLKKLFDSEELFLLNSYKDFKKEFSEFLKSDLYKNLTNKSMYINFKIDNDFSKYIQILEYCVKYRKIFKKITSNDTFNYLKRLPKINDVNLIKNDLKLFDDIFIGKAIDNYVKSENIILSISNLNVNNILKYLKEKNKITDFILADIKDYRYTNGDRFISDILIYLKEELKQKVDLYTVVRYHLNSSNILDSLFYKTDRLNGKVTKEDSLYMFFRDVEFRTIKL